jgi:hypothetical protein
MGRTTDLFHKRPSIRLCVMTAQILLSEPLEGTPAELDALARRSV